MTTNCALCNTPLPDAHPAVASTIINEWANWDSFESDNARWGYPVGKTFDVPGLDGTVEVVHKKTSSAEYQDSYGELPQGTEFETHIILKLATGDYLKKCGSGNSYGDITWNGTLRPVIPVEKTVTVYEFN